MKMTCCFDCVSDQFSSKKIAGDVSSDSKGNAILGQGKDCPPRSSSSKLHVSAITPVGWL